MTDQGNSLSEIDERILLHAQRLFRIETHLKREEFRPARAQLRGFLDELVLFSDELGFPIESVLTGARLGLLTGPPFVRGRLPALLFGAVGGWLWGHHHAEVHRRELSVIIDRVEELHMTLAQQIEEPGNQFHVVYAPTDYA
jgi:hypothetical protein